MMKILCAVAFAISAVLAVAVAPSSATAAVHAVPEPAPARPAARQPAPTFATWHMADLQDVTQAWYFTGEALAGQGRDGAPWAGERPIARAADAVLALPPPPSPATQASPAQVTVPPTLPEPHMASMLLVGLVLIFLRTSHKEAAFG